MKKIILLVVIITGFSTISISQPINLDSLNQIWNDQAQPDSNRFSSMRLLIGYGFLKSDPDTAVQLSKKFFEETKKVQNKKYMGAALNFQALAFGSLGKHNESLESYSLSLALYKELDLKIGIANVLGNMGNVYLRLGNSEEAINHQAQSLKIKKEIGSLSGVAATLLNIGNIYDSQGDTSKALSYYLQSKEQYKSIGDSSGVARALSNVGSIYDKQAHPLKALTVYARSLNIYNRNNQLYNKAKLLNNIGASYLQLNQYSESLNFFNQALKMNQELGNQVAAAQNMVSIGWLYQYQNKYPLAIEFGEQSLTIALRSGDKDITYKAANLLARVLKDLNKGMKALEMYELEIQMRDSIKSEEAKKGILKMEVEHEFEKQQIIAKQEAEELVRIEAEKVSRRNTLQYSGIGLGIFALFGLVFLFGRIQLPNWAVELSVFLPFLILFEFLLVITDPYLDGWSGGEPLIKLGLNVLMAGAIFPLHSFFERYLKRRLFKDIGT